MFKTILTIVIIFVALYILVSLLETGSLYPALTALANGAKTLASK